MSSVLNGQNKDFIGKTISRGALQTKVSHKKPSKEHKTCYPELDYFKGFYIIRSAIIYFGGLFSFSRDTPPVATQNRCASFSRQGYYFILLWY